MLSRKILIVITILTALSILHDLHDISFIRNDTKHKLEYLHSLHPTERIDGLYAGLLENFEIKEFETLRNLLSLDPQTYDISDPSQWSDLVDKPDHNAFLNELDKIPHVKNSLQKETLISVRDSLIYSDLLQYAVYKTSIMSGCYINQYDLIKDNQNDIYLMDPRSVERLRFDINGQSKVGLDHSNLIPKVDSITITSYQKIRPSSRNLSASGYYKRDTIVHRLAI